MVRAQFTMEFIMLFAIAFLVFLVLLTFVTQYIDYSNNKAEQKKLNTLAESIRRDIALAHESGSGFESRLVVPDKLDGTPITINIDADILLIKSTYTNTTVVKALPDVEGSLVPGCNIIKKENDKIQISTC